MGFKKGIKREIAAYPAPPAAGGATAEEQQQQDKEQQQEHHPIIQELVLHTHLDK